MKMSNQRTAYGKELVRIGAENKRLVVLECDLGKSTRSCEFQDAYPDRYFEMGIAEANMTSFAAGLSLTNRVAVTNSFAVFAAGRAYDQIRQSIATARLNVKIVGSSAGLSDFGDGATHQSIDDIAIMRAIPNMNVLVPADAPQAAAMLRYAIENDGPFYLRISRNDLPELTDENTDPIAPQILNEGSDAAVLACGTMVSRALEAAELLLADGITLRVINVPCIKPFPDEKIRGLVADVKAVVACEEHSVIGGLTSSVAWALRGMRIQLESISVNDSFGQSAKDAEELTAEYGLDAKSIAATVKKSLIK